MTTRPSDNLRGMTLMSLAMALFATADAFIKVLSQTHPQGQIILVAGIGGTVLFVLAALAAGQMPLTRDIAHPGVLARVAAEAIGTVGIVTALALAPLSVVVAIMQSVPLIVTLGAALILREAVGWRRWTAIAVGLAGVLLILRPGAGEVSLTALWAVLGAVCLAMRDLCTRLVPPSATNLQLGAWGFAGLIPAGLLLLGLGAAPTGPYTPGAIVLFAAVTGSTVVAILAITMSMRMGEVSAIAPFRYMRLVFGLALAVLWFGERPDGATWIGAVLIAGAGLYAVARERRVRR